MQDLGRKIAGVVGRDSFVIRRLRPFYEAALDFSHGRRGVPWQLNGEQYRISPYHRDRFGDPYDPEVAAFLKERIKSGAVCFDVGANVGVYVLQLARWVGSAGRVVAFEPNPAARELLTRHVEWNGFEERVSIERSAVSSEAGTMTMFAHESDGMSRLGQANILLGDKAQKIEVPVRTLSDFCEERQIAPDWVIIDIEGFEIQALIGFEQFLMRSPKRVEIIMEMHPNVWTSAGTSVESAQAVFERLRRAPVALSGQRDVWSQYGHVYCQPI